MLPKKKSGRRGGRQFWGRLKLPLSKKRERERAQQWQQQNDRCFIEKRSKWIQRYDVQVQVHVHTEVSRNSRYRVKCSLVQLDLYPSERLTRGGRGRYQGKIVELITEYLSQEKEVIDNKIELIYRVNLNYAENKNLPWDIIIQFGTKKLKEDIMLEQYKHPLEFEGKKIIVMENYHRRSCKKEI